MPTRKKSSLVTGTAFVALTAGILLGGGRAGAASAGSTTAAPPTGASISGQGAIPSAPKTATPKGYVIVNSGPLSNPPGESQGTATCPAGTVVWGGGVTDSRTVQEVINSSWPNSPTTWSVFIENASPSAGTFTVYAVCAKQLKRYVIESNDATGPPETQTRVVAQCPAKTVVLGGGAHNTSFDSAHTINSTFPEGDAWASDINNASGADATVTDYAICGTKPSKYVVVTGSTSDNPPGAYSSSSAACPSKTSVLSAAVVSNAPATDVSINEILPDVDVLAYEFNNSPGDYKLTAFAVCAK